MTIKQFMIIPGMLFMAALLCTSIGLAQDGAKNFAQGAEELGLSTFRQRRRAPAWLMY
jgi:hypothetical protein